MFKWVEHEVQRRTNTQTGSAQGKKKHFTWLYFMYDVRVWWHKSFLLSWLLPPSACGLAVLAPTPSRHHFCAVLTTLWAGAHAASHQRILPNTLRTTFINVTGLLPTVHFFLRVPQVHFSCSCSPSGYLVWPVPLQQCTCSISFKVLQSYVSADMNYIVYLELCLCPAYRFYLAYVLSLRSHIMRVQLWLSHWLKYWLPHSYNAL